MTSAFYSQFQPGQEQAIQQYQLILSTQNPAKTLTQLYTSYQTRQNCRLAFQTLSPKSMITYSRRFLLLQLYSNEYLQTWCLKEVSDYTYRRYCIKSEEQVFRVMIRNEKKQQKFGWKYYLINVILSIGLVLIQMAKFMKSYTNSQLSKCKELFYQQEPFYYRCHLHQNFLISAGYPGNQQDLAQKMYILKTQIFLSSSYIADPWTLFCFWRYFVSSFKIQQFSSNLIVQIMALAFNLLLLAMYGYNLVGKLREDRVRQYYIELRGGKTIEIRRRTT